MKNVDSDEGIIELRRIREEMAIIQGMNTQKSRDLEVAIYHLAGAIRALAGHIEHLEKRAK